ncbi:hypothetical protein QQX98_007030 [Neonectria punicea]|uniref:Uncharacterized protein n=1 Tax=Neonectria punicea TaxID=979145 RepID=A0ABR1GZ36_9HYPO
MGWRKERRQLPRAPIGLELKVGLIFVVKLTKLERRDGRTKKSATLHLALLFARPARTLTLAHHFLLHRTRVFFTMNTSAEQLAESRDLSRHAPPASLRASQAPLPETLPLPEATLGPEPSARKRHITDSDDGDSDSDRPRVKRAYLTRKNLEFFDKMTNSGPGSSASTVSTTSPGFAYIAENNGILKYYQSKPPTNLKQILERHTRSAVCAPITRKGYKDFVSKVRRAPNEATIVFESGQVLLKKYTVEGYHRVFDLSFAGFPKDIGFNNGLSPPQPDFLEGLLMDQFKPFRIGEHISGAVVYRHALNSVALSHIAGEWKGPGKDVEEATIQSAYDGAALVYARNEALTYLGQSDPPGHAEITTFTSDGKFLKNYAHYAVELKDKKIEYHQYLYAETNLLESHDSFNKGRRGLHNAQDHAKKQSCALMEQLKSHWERHGGGLPPIAGGIPPIAGGIPPIAVAPAVSSTDEEEDDGETPPGTPVPVGGSHTGKRYFLRASTRRPL